MCPKCSGLVAEPGKAYGYAGKFCHCGSPQRSLMEPAQLAPCHCAGPRPGEPVCPCQMRDVRVIGGRYVLTRDLGPAPPKPDPKFFGTD